jgi:hypothetical protein
MGKASDGSRTLAEVIAAIQPPNGYSKEQIDRASEAAAEYAKSVVTETEPHARKMAWLQAGRDERNRLLKAF